MRKIRVTLFLFVVCQFCYADDQYLKGKVTYGKGNPEKAVKIFQECASKGDKRCMYAAGAHLLRGDGVEQNEKKAIELLEKSASMDYGLSQQMLAFAYSDGIGVSMDNKKAELYFERATNNCMPNSLHDYGYLLFMGKKGVKQDKLRAVKYLFVAKELHHPQVANALDMIEPNINKNEFNRAKSKAKEMLESDQCLMIVESEKTNVY